MIDADRFYRALEGKHALAQLGEQIGVSTLDHLRV